MRTSLPLTSGTRLRPSETRRDGRRRGRLLGRLDRGAVRESPAGAVRTVEAVRDLMQAPAPIADAAAQRVRDAGGPLDEATYTCQCGCMFAAAVTTSVACPHCGGAQAW